jgi:hypothetical protein
MENFNMRTYSETLPDSHQVSDLKLFAAQFLMRRYHLAPHTAEVIALLAGLGLNEEAW